MSCSKSCDPSRMEECIEYFPTVYILSRIAGLFEALESLKFDFCPQLQVKKIELPDESDCLNERAVQFENVEVLLADPISLAENYRLMPKLKWAHCTWNDVSPLFAVIENQPDFIVTRHTNVDVLEKIAEFVLVQVLICEKQLIWIRECQEERDWEMMSVNARMAKNRRLRELTVAILGIGNIGMSIARLFKAHRSNVIGLSEKPRAKNQCGFFDSIETDLEKVFSEADYIVNTLPSTPRTIGLLSDATFIACKRAPVFINVGQADIIDESSLIEALQNGWLSHAVLDVFDQEPLPAESRLWSMPNEITISPHCVAISEQNHVAKDFISHFMQYQQKEAFLKNHLVDFVNKC